MRAIIASGDYTPMLEAMREHSVPTIVVHGENDLVVPFESAQDMAERADGALYRVPGAYHSWMLANPRHGADMVRQLLAAELGDVLRDTARAHGIMGVPGGWQDAADRGFTPALAGGSAAGRRRRRGARPRRDGPAAQRMP